MQCVRFDYSFVRIPNLIVKPYGRMHGVVGQRGKPGLIRCVLDEFNDLIGQLLHAFGIIRTLILVQVPILDTHFKAVLLLRHRIAGILMFRGRQTAQMPFTHPGRVIPVLLEQLPDGHFLPGKPPLPFRNKKRFLRMPAPRDPVGQSSTRGVFTRHNTSPGRRTDRCRGISFGKPRPFACQLVDVGRFIEIAAIAAKVPPPHIIDDNQQNIGLLRFSSVTDMNKTEYQQTNPNGLEYSFSHFQNSLSV